PSEGAALSAAHAPDVSRSAAIRRSIKLRLELKCFTKSPLPIAGTVRGGLCTLGRACVRAWKAYNAAPGQANEFAGKAKSSPLRYCLTWPPNRSCGDTLTQCLRAVR